MQFLRRRNSTFNGLTFAARLPNKKTTRMEPIKVTKFVTKSHQTPDEVRTPEKTRAEIVRLDGFTLGRMQMDPGWKWSQNIKPIVHTESCQLSHVGYALSGSITVRLNDGTEKIIKAGDSYSIPPGHDAWVNGNEPFVGLEMVSAEQFAKPQDTGNEGQKPQAAA